MNRRDRPPYFVLGLVVLFIPVALGLTALTGLVPHTRGAQIGYVLMIIACVGTGSYLAIWGMRPRRRRGDWLPSDTLQ